jgi:methylenetetrahydrofolate--tRNA-(uracil-5-)-methyltransferase
MSRELIVIGGGLAGSEAAWQAARRGLNVLLFEMRPEKLTGAHTTGMLGELVCSNSLRSNDIYSAPGLLKKELFMGGSLVMEAAYVSSVPAGTSLAVDRKIFSNFITERLSGNTNIDVIREEVCKLPDSMAIIATGPLTSEAMTKALTELIGENYLYFYDAISPIIDADSIDYKKVYRASRYGKGGDDYLNAPMSKDEYREFYNAILEADRITPRKLEEESVFEGCMPIEVMASRGIDTLRYGPMKPVGLPDPGTGCEPYAVIQLRAENKKMSAYNMVGFQTRLKWPEQKKVFRFVKGLESAEFLRYGSIHRNTFINSPLFLNKNLTLKNRNNLFIAGQLSGVEGYIESTAMGLIAGINASLILKGRRVNSVPVSTAHGALIRHITETESKNFQPSNINFGLFPVPDELLRVKDKKQKNNFIVEKAVQDWTHYLKRIELECKV